MPRSIRVLVAVLGFFVTCVMRLAAATPPSSPAVTPRMTELITAHRAVLDIMNTPGRDGRLRQLDEAQMRTLLTQGWELAADWAGAWLDLHTDPSSKDLDNLFVDFTPQRHDPEVYDPKLPDLYAMEGSATRIARDLYVVSAAYEESQSANATSTFFVVARDANGHFVPKWSIKPVAERHYRSRDEIGLWAFLDSCAYYCGPLVVQRVIPLAPLESGPSRFAIDAFQATNGSTLMKQLSVWQWNGNDAENLAIRSYRQYIDEDRSIQIVGDLLTVPTKEQTESFSAFGCCAEPRGIWMLRIGPEKTQDLGRVFLQPEILWADRLLAASRTKSPLAATLGSPAVIAYLRQTEFDGIMVDKCRIVSRGRRRSFEITFGEGVRLWLAYRLRNGQPYFTDVRVE